MLLLVEGIFGRTMLFVRVEVSWRDSVSKEIQEGFVFLFLRVRGENFSRVWNFLRILPPIKVSAISGRY